VYDAEMEGLARGAEAAREWLQQTGTGHGVRRIRLFADNTGAIQRIYKGTPGLNQTCSKRFREATHHILDTHPDLNLDILWVPGHRNIPGNDIADRLAKRGCSDAPARPGYTTAAFAGNICRRALRDRWHNAWEQDTNRADFSIANKLAPAINPPKRFKELDRKLFSRVLQCRTGHAHIGSYYDYFAIDEPRSCICGIAFQTREHILTSCTYYENLRHKLEDDSGTIRLSDVLASTKGIARLANFIAETGAYDKPPAV